jgi:hypothetical protein
MKNEEKQISLENTFFIVFIYFVWSDEKNEEKPEAKPRLIIPVECAALSMYSSRTLHIVL